MVIIDTSIWIEFFRSHDPTFSQVSGLLDSGKLLGLPWVFGELLQGAHDNREINLLHAYWRAIPKPDTLISEKAWIQAGIESQRGDWVKKGVGLIDAAIIAAALEMNTPVATYDKKLREILKFKKLLFSF